jgi:hypothetical protein
VLRFTFNPSFILKAFYCFSIVQESQWPQICLLFQKHEHHTNIAHAVVSVISRCIKRCQHCNFTTLTFRNSNGVAGVCVCVCVCVCD